MADAGRSSSHKLDDLARRYLGQAMISYGQVSAGDEGERTLDLVSAREVARYAVEDACVARRLMPVLQERLDELELRPLFEEVEAPLVAVLEEMEHDGILIDEERLAAMARRMHGELERLEREIHDLAGRPFNIKSPQQLRGVLFDELGLSPSGRRTQKTKVHSTGQEVLEALSEKHPLPGKVLEYRELAKLVGTYVEALPKLIDERDGRLHTRFHQLGAATGRLSSSDPNLQNIPIRTRAGREIRQAFVPEEGRVFLSADYSQMELRILAHLARDEALIEAFRRDEDIHRFTAAAVMGLAPAEVTPELRSRAKAVNFGIVYGMSEFRLAREQGMSREEARAFIDAYFARYGRLRRYVESVHESVQETGVVRTLLGRVRHFPELLARGEESPGGRLNRMTREALLRQAVNTTVQGSGADIVKRAMVQLAERLHDAALPARLVLQVHDELLLEVEEGRVEEVARLVRDVMEGAVELAVPLRVETHAGRTWSDAH
jgi:DNA polymerase-1